MAQKYYHNKNNFLGDVDTMANMILLYVNIMFSNHDRIGRCL